MLVLNLGFALCQVLGACYMSWLGRSCSSEIKDWLQIGCLSKSRKVFTIVDISIQECFSGSSMFCIYQLKDLGLCFSRHSSLGLEHLSCEERLGEEKAQRGCYSGIEMSDERERDRSFLVVPRQEVMGANKNM